MALPLRVGILAGESSGDILGAGLMQALGSHFPDLRFEGIGGPLMEAAGLKSMVPMERLAVMGLTEPLKRLPELLRIRKMVVQHFAADPPAVFIGIDSPDFNLGLELQLRQKGIPTVHYVSPSVWAWRQGRIRKIAAACDLVLTLFPFEAAFYRQHQVPVEFVGHPLADLVPLEPDQAGARAELGLAQDRKTVALLPGSRRDEVHRLGGIFLQAAALLVQQYPELQLVLPCANAARGDQIRQMTRSMKLDLTIIEGQSRRAMEAADVVLLASGTAALEAMLYKVPMLVCYRMGWLSYAIISRMVKTPYFSLPNLLAGEPLVDELIQNQVQPILLAEKIGALLASETAKIRLQQRFLDLHQQLRLGASDRAASAVHELIRKRS